MMEMKQRKRGRGRGIGTVKAKGLIMSVINDKACSLHGAWLLIMETQLHLGPTKNRWTHDNA